MVTRFPAGSSFVAGGAAAGSQLDVDVEEEARRRREKEIDDIEYYSVLNASHLQR